MLKVFEENALRDSITYTEHYLHRDSITYMDHFEGSGLPFSI